MSAGESSDEIFAGANTNVAKIKDNSSQEVWYERYRSATTKLSNALRDPPASLYLPVGVEASSKIVLLPSAIAKIVLQLCRVPVTTPSLSLSRNEHLVSRPVCEPLNAAMLGLVTGGSDVVGVLSCCPTGARQVGHTH